MSELKGEDYQLIRDFVDGLIKEENSSIDLKMNEHIESIIQSKNWESLDDRNYIHNYLDFMKSKLFNYFVNSHIYFLNEKEINNVQTMRLTLVNIISKLRGEEVKEKPNLPDTQYVKEPSLFYFKDIFRNLFGGKNKNIPPPPPDRVLKEGQEPIPPKSYLKK